jgi:hypothetical protein
MPGSALATMALAPVIVMMMVPAAATAGESDAAGTTAPNGAATVGRPEPPPTELASTKRHMDPRALADKREGWHVAGLPLVNSDPDAGIGLGLRGYYYWNGYRDDALFGVTPYLHRALVQAFATTNGYQAHLIDYDGPYLGHTHLRLRATLSYERNIAANYYGRGAGTLEPPTFPGSAEPFATDDSYQQALGALQPDGTAYTRYNQYDIEQPIARAAVERDFFGGVVRVQVGLIGSYVRLRDYTGAAITAAGGVGAVEAATRLHDDCAAHVIVGCENAWDNLVKLGAAYDTRDYEPDPTAGVFLGVATEMSSRALGSRYEYIRLTEVVRGYWSPFPAWTRLVLAGRAAYSVQFGDVPFYDMGTLAFTDGDQSGLGGLRTLRGFRQERFVGRNAALANVELRWTLYTVAPGKLRLHFFVAPFLDGGRPFDRVSETTMTGWKIGRGAAFRVGINQATIISVDYATSSEGAGLYINFGQQF